MDEGRESPTHLSPLQGILAKHFSLRASIALCINAERSYSNGQVKADTVLTQIRRKPIPSTDMEQVGCD